MKLADKGSFAELLNKCIDCAIPYRIVRKWLVDISVTLAVLHNNGIAHR
jgi:serine/threonine protein kinase